MKCSDCQTILGTDWLFCAHCGIKVEVPGQVVDFSPSRAAYGSAVRAQVLEVVIRQALAGAPWKEVCRGPMLVNDISVEEVEDAVRRRGGRVTDSLESKGSKKNRLQQQMNRIRRELYRMLADNDESPETRLALDRILADFEEILNEV